jgi:arylsulfatase A-like enzyme
MSCARRSGGLPPNVVWIVVDTLRADHLGCYGGSVHTPAIDRLAAGGARFEWAYSHAPLTLPSHASMFSSRYPYELGVRNNGDALTDNAELFAEGMREAGFSSLGVVSLGTANSRTGLAQGFDSYRDSPEAVPCIAEKTCQRLFTDGALDHWTAPFHLFLHLADPHKPYRAHGTFEHWVTVHLNDDLVARVDVSSDPRAKIRGLLEGRNRIRITSDYPLDLHQVTFHPQEAELDALAGFEPQESMLGRMDGEATLEITAATSTSRRAQFTLRFREILDRRTVQQRYALEVEYVDRQLEKALAYLDGLGMMDNALVVFTADHGEGLGGKGGYGHARFLYEDQIRIPLILCRPPSIPEGLVVPTRVRHVDLVPTVCALLDLPAPKGARGADLMPVIAGEDDTDRPVLSATFRPEATENLVALLDGDYKLIHHLDSGRDELYRPRQDPTETTDLAADSADAVRKLLVRLEELQRETGFPDAAELAAPPDTPVDDSTLEMLRALGYVRSD